MRSFVGIIPARWKSKRYPGKPLCDIKGYPMVWHVYEQAKKWKNFNEVYVATDDMRIMDTCEFYSIPCIMTSNEHTDCLDRACEASIILARRGDGAHRYIIIQGDEPLFNVETLNTNYDKPCINFYTKSISDVSDPNSVKVVVSDSGRALYFSRFSIPHYKPDTARGSLDSIPVHKQIGVYAFTGAMLETYNNLAISTLEIAEGIGLNRMLEADIDVHMVYTPHDSISVDTPADREKVIKIMRTGL